ncbi:glutathione S-transferase family protein [Salinisphaera sp.]|uniref:glutathione S-transferase family protein n=1 Tax=Salinisphaera sp. TaxID=1914330 RepID=UPI000C6BBD3E|nr:glutathione S-transferase family protein [Salinisphaera sp.]MBS63901.1 glutathione-dependent reductase [Salinisphaera sp.]
MGLLVEGQWKDPWYDTDSTGGKFVRESAGFRDWVSADPDSRFTAEAGRYHLYVSLACPWAHRTLILRKLKGLESAIGLSIVDPYMGEWGWSFSDAPGTIRDPLYGLDHLFELYQKAASGYTGRVTTPTLWDRHHETIVSNESADIVRMFNSAFDTVAEHPERDYYPSELRAEIDAVNERVYHDVNNGVYKAGFATTQDAYEQAFEKLFATLDWLDARLAEQRYLAGSRITEADWRLFVTLVRFDAVYVGHFKCNLRRIADYPHLSGYLRELYQVPGIAETTNFDHIKQHYYRSHPTINPTGIVPVGPALDLYAPHGRAAAGAVT